MLVDFIGVKIGDVNGSAEANSGKSVSGDTVNNMRLSFDLDEQELLAGQLYELNLKANAYKDVMGWQGTLSFDPNLVRVIS
jgi:hypothetical protein